MRFFKAISAALLVTLSSASAAPKFAMVRIRDIFSGLPSTLALHLQIKNEREAIMDNERAQQLRAIIAELQALQAQLSDKSKPLDETTSAKLARTYELKRQEAQTLQRDFETFKADQEKILNKKMVEGMRDSLNRISSLAGSIAKERGYDLVLDSSGNTNTGVAFVLFSKNPADLTTDVEAALKDSESKLAPQPATPALEIPPY